MTNCQSNMRRPCRSGYAGFNGQNSYNSQGGQCGQPGFDGRGGYDSSPSSYRSGSPCSCPDQNMTELPRDAALAMAYVPWQRWGNIYEPCKGFQQGTIFECLDKPFTGKGGRRQ